MVIQIGTYDIETVSFSAGTRTITVENFYETFNMSNVKLITVHRDPSAGANGSFVIAAPSYWLASITEITSGTYEIEYSSNLPELESGDTVFISVEILNPTYDLDSAVQKTINQSPEWAHYTDQLEIGDYTNQAAGVTRDVIYSSGYKHHMLALLGSTGADNSVTINLQVPGVSTAVDTDDVDWIDITNLITGSNDLIITSGTTDYNEIFFIDTDIIFDRLMVRSEFANGGTATNTLTISHKQA